VSIYPPPTESLGVPYVPAVGLSSSFQYLDIVVFCWLVVRPFPGPFTTRKEQGYLAHKHLVPPGTLQEAYAWGPMVVLGELKFFMSEVPLWPATLPSNPEPATLNPKP